MDTIVLRRLSDNDMQTAYLLRMRYCGLDKPCSASIVYFLPYFNGRPMPNMDSLQNYIANAMGAKATDIVLSKRDIEYEGIKDRFFSCYNNGRQLINQTIRLTAEIPSTMWEGFSLENKTVPEYYFHFNMYLNYLGVIPQSFKHDLTFSSFPLRENKAISWAAKHYESL